MDRVLENEIQNTNQYTLLHDAYYGTGMFWLGGGLRRHPRESDANYFDRQRLAYYLNYMGPIVNASVDPIFLNEIKRDYNENKLFDAFIDDVDRRGTDLQDYIRRSAIYAKLYGVVYLVMNNEVDLDEAMAKNIQARKFPFVKTVLPQNVLKWDFDTRGVINYFEYQEIVENGEGKKTTQRYIWTPDEYRIVTSSGETIMTGINPLGEVPVVQWFGRNTEPINVKPPPEFLSVAQTNYHLYQLCSWHTQILRDQAFSILTLPSDGNTDITVGTNNTLAYPPESTHTPAFISPDAAPATMLTDQIDRLINEMYRMSGIDSVVGVQEAKSGVAKQWDFERTNQRLADFAIQCENAEKRLVDLFENWTGTVVGYVCEYPRDFKINDVTESLTQAQAALDLGFNSPTYHLEVAKKVLSTYMANIEPETYDAIVADISASETELEQLRVAQMQGLMNADNSDGGADGTNGNGQDNQSI